MSTSGGGGYCDCGDDEAFLAHAMCDKCAATKAKSGDPNSSPDAESLKRFPSDAKERAELLFSAVCKYCMLVTSERHADPKSVRKKERISMFSITFRKLEMFHVGAKEKETWQEVANCFAHNTHCLVLSNDNVHSYYDVTRALKVALPDASDKIVQDLTELVDKEGRAILKVGVYKVSLDAGRWAPTVSFTHEPFRSRIAL